MFEKFTEYMDCQLAISEKSRELVHQIRHRVYCEELNFEPQKVSRMETDEFDDFSLFCMIKQRSTDKVAGCVRLVSPEHSDHMLPLEKHCENVITDPNYKLERFRRESLCEISRLAIPLEFRRRRDENRPKELEKPISQLSEEEKRTFPLISLALYFAAASMGVQKGHEHCFVMMEPRLARSMRLLGIPFVQVGPAIEFRGKRAPYYINAELFHSRLTPELVYLFREIDGRVKQGMMGITPGSVSGIPLKTTTVPLPSSKFFN